MSDTFITDTFSRILSACESLENLYLGVRTTLDLGSHFSQEQISLNNLKFLHIETHTSLPKILEKIVAPKIQQLHIIKGTNFMTNRISSILPFISNLKSLDSISINGPQILKERIRFEITVLEVFKLKPVITWNEWKSNKNYNIYSSDTESEEEYNEGASDPDDIETYDESD
jgi:hypothetical protein